MENDKLQAVTHTGNQDAAGPTDAGSTPEIVPENVVETGTSEKIRYPRRKFVPNRHDRRRAAALKRKKKIY